MVFIYFGLTIAIKQEAQTNTFNITGFDIDTVKQMLRYMYGAPGVFDSTTNDDKTNAAASQAAGDDEIDEEKKKAIRDEQLRKDDRQLISLVRLNCIADFYRLDNLVEEVNAKIQEFLVAKWNVTKFLNAARVVASDSGDENLHSLFTKFAAEHIEEIEGCDLQALSRLDRFVQEFVTNICDRMLNLQQTVTDSQKKATGTVAAAENCFNILNNEMACRHCNWTSRYQVPYSPGCPETYIVKCLNCNEPFPM